MITVTNRIKVKKGIAEKMAPQFVQPGPLQEFEGFQKVEVLVSTQFEEYDEMSVVMYGVKVMHSNNHTNVHLKVKAEATKANLQC